MSSLRKVNLSYSCSKHSANVLRPSLSRIWNPTGGITTTNPGDGHEMLVRAGYLRQSHPGMFHFLPLGVRVLDKMERLLDEEMAGIGASKVSLSSITSRELWEKTGRFGQLESELFKVADRRGVSYMLSPTHEEEMTMLVSRLSHSYKDLPLRLYQISRKYRDELRPRHGLLRCREFIMKDLYTFDASLESALQTYEEVRQAYSRFFTRLQLPFLAAEASSGDMGGSMSHEYHTATALGEDHVVSCATCGYASNEEVAGTGFPAEAAPALDSASRDMSNIRVWRGISRDRHTLVNAWYPSHTSSLADINPHAVRRLVPDLDLGVEDPAALWEETLASARAGDVDGLLVNLVDHRIRHLTESLESTGQDGPLPIFPGSTSLCADLLPRLTMTTFPDGTLLNLVRIQNGDSCPRCKAPSLALRKSLELGHTFHLGTRYSEPMGAHVFLPSNKTNQCLDDQAVPFNAVQRPYSSVTKAPIQMGCYGIGLTRLVGAIASKFADIRGLQWPLDIAPYEVVIIPDKDLGQEAETVYDAISSLGRRRGNCSLPIDLVIDDRRESMAWKMKDADLVGYPILVIIGRAWRQGAGCEVQCRKMGTKDTVTLDHLPHHLAGLLTNL